MSYISPISIQVSRGKYSDKKTNIKQYPQNNNISFGNSVLKPAKSVKKSKSIIGKISALFLSFLNIKKNTEDLSQNYLIINQDINSLRYKELVEKYPDIAKELDECDSFSFFEGDCGIDYKHYSDIAKPFLLEEYDKNSIKGEKLLDLFYCKNDDASKKLMKKFQNSPELIDIKHSKIILNGRQIDKEL